MAALVVASMAAPASASSPRIYVGPPPTHQTYDFEAPGSAAQVTSLVASSVSMTSVPSNLDPPLDVVAGDNFNDIDFHTNGSGCSTPADCTYGDVSGSKLVVLFGDSHAWMWLAAVDPVMVSLGYRLQLLWKPGCAAADLDFAVTACTTWRTQMLKLIRSEHPTLVLLAERTANIDSTGSTLVTVPEWITALETTIRDLQSATTKVVVIGDNPAYANDVDPATCLSTNEDDVQACDTPVRTAKAEWVDHIGAEKRAVIETRAGFINPLQWLCTATTCAPIVGNMVVYLNWSHLTATYSEYLSRVMGTKIKEFLPPTAS